MLGDQHGREPESSFPLHPLTPHRTLRGLSSVSLSKAISQACCYRAVARAITPFVVFFSTRPCSLPFPSCLLPWGCTPPYDQVCFSTEPGLKFAINGSSIVFLDSAQLMSPPLESSDILAFLASFLHAPSILRSIIGITVPCILAYLPHQTVTLSWTTLCHCILSTEHSVI